MRRQYKELNKLCCDILIGKHKVTKQRLGSTVRQGCESRGCLLVVEALNGAGVGADHGHLGGVGGGAAVEEGPGEGRPLLLRLLFHVMILQRRCHGMRLGRGSAEEVDQQGEMMSEGDDNR